MPRYSAPFTKTGADSVLQHVEVLSSATVQRTKWYSFVTAKSASPADAHVQFVIRRVTGSATGTALTPSPIDPSDAACRGTAEHLITADAASFASGTELFRAPLNDRATYTWYANDGQELVGAAVSANGLSLGVSAANTATFSGTVFFAE